VGYMTAGRVGKGEKADRGGGERGVSGHYLEMGGHEKRRGASNEEVALGKRAKLQQESKKTLKRRKEGDDVETA